MSGRLVAIIPAAGLSRRMGQPKLLLPYHGTTILGSLLGNLSHPRITQSYLIVRKDDHALQQEARQHPCTLLLPPVDPPDMRSSVEFAIEQIQTRDAFDPSDGLILIPADHPCLSSQLLNELLTIWDTQQPEILVPTYHGKRGHPTFFRGSTLPWFREIPPDQGINWILRQHAAAVHEWSCADSTVIQDLDTPDDYQRLLNPQ